jgi:GMP synthase (glutamine-hydrolysing)
MCVVFSFINLTILCFQILHEFNLLKSISQMPVVLIPLHFDRDPVDRKPSAQRSIVLRPFSTNDFMTGMPVVPGSEQLPIQVTRKFFFVNNI